MKGLTNIYTSILRRRSFYNITNKSPLSEIEVKQIVGNAILHTPTAFNSQTGRVVILFGKDHDKLWDITKNSLKNIVPEENFEATEKRIDGFKAGFGTVLFFEDQDTIQSLEESYPLYKDNFQNWSQQSSGMLQYIVWTCLESECLGVSLQHYNPIIDAEVMNQWDIPESWKLIAQMPFGKANGPASKKQFKSLEERIKVFNS